MNFSIIIPFYNNSKNLPELSETLNDYINDPKVEIIFIDDHGAISDYKNLIHHFKEFSNVIILRNKNNEGPSYSRMKGVDISRGEYIFFLDADDGWVKNRAYLIYNFCKKNNISILGGKAELIGRKDYIINRKKDSKFKVFNTRPVTILYAIFFNPFATSSVCVKREVIANNRFNINMKYAEDIDCWRRILIQRPLSMKLKHSGSFTFKHPYLSNQGLSSNTTLMTKGAVDSLYYLYNYKNENNNLLIRLLILAGIIFSYSKGILRRLRVRIRSFK